MHPYIPFLLEDIKAGERPESVRELSTPATFEEEMEEIERWVSGGNDEHNFGYYCGLKKEQFPPQDQLSVEDIKRVFKAFERLLFSWNAEIDLPDELPWWLRYQFMLKTLGEEFTPVATGFITFDFCSGYAPDCEFGKYCSCFSIWNEANKNGRY